MPFLLDTNPLRCTPPLPTPRGRRRQPVWSAYDGGFNVAESGGYNYDST